MTLDDGSDLNDTICNLHPPSDPFATKQEILCQQLAWHMEDLEPHCDRERHDKTHERQKPSDDGVGDRITSLTLRVPCWLLLRPTSDHHRAFAVRLQPGDVYSLSGESRWNWQHAVMLDELPANTNLARVSIVWRILEEYPS